MFFSSLLLSSWALYFSQPLSRTRSPSRSRNSSNAGPELSLLYMSSSELCPARQYITPTFRWKFSYIRRRRSKEFRIILTTLNHLFIQTTKTFHIMECPHHLTSYFTAQKAHLCRKMLHTYAVYITLLTLWIPFSLQSSGCSMFHTQRDSLFFISELVKPQGWRQSLSVVGDFKCSAAFAMQSWK